MRGERRNRQALVIDVKGGLRAGDVEERTPSLGAHITR